MNWQSQVNFFKEAVKLSPQGGIDTVVANAGITESGMGFEKPEDLDSAEPPKPNLAVVDVNLYGLLYTTHLALFWLPRNPNSQPVSLSSSPATTLRDHHLLLIGSTVSLYPMPGRALYGASKHGVCGLFRTLRSSSFVYGVRVNMLYPYFIHTPLLPALGRLVLAGAAIGKIEDVIDAGMRFAADTRISGRSLVVGPEMKVERQGGGEWVLASKGGEDMTAWEPYIDDYREGDIYMQRTFADVGSLKCNHRLFPPTSKIAYNATTIPSAPFQPPDHLSYRLPDTLDTFATYKYRNICNVSSLDLHSAFSPLCSDGKSMLTAMSSGGRIGTDAPYMPRGCDMRWFSTEEVCEILGRFKKVIFVGDSMIRHVIGSINILIRKDLAFGALTNWNFNAEERKDCFCNTQFDVTRCSLQGIFGTADVMKNDPSSVACQANSIDVVMEQMVRFPIASEEVDRFKALIGNTKPARPYVFIFGHGLWNDLDLQATLDWLDQILDMTLSQLPYLGRPGAFWPRLFLTPNAAGKEKPNEWIVTQGNKALMLFEESVGVEANRRGVEHLGTWNMSIQSNKYDGVHLDMRGNLVKAMMVMNWLNLLEVEKH
ncbi:hypothetical protein FGG08_001926 [Glutinoglossum americanum]|uniref:Uncharacterized protein n=1 Tax=Glutinoglossum americanum TaxID=1670608 RepID=A0A9P8IA96_9PEZI|nr:hypothetical protein FGG08_001926 [Glutinoglossum americanum]